jgi:hypothetical protein
MVVRMGRHTVHLAGRRVACIRALPVLVSYQQQSCVNTQIVTWICVKFLGNVYDFQISWNGDGNGYINGDSDPV